MSIDVTSRYHSKPSGLKKAKALPDIWISSEALSGHVERTPTVEIIEDRVLIPFDDLISERPANRSTAHSDNTRWHWAIRPR